MANTIQLKRSSTAAATPSTGSLSLGELAVNTNDGVIYTKKNDGSDKIVSFPGVYVESNANPGSPVSPAYRTTLYCITALAGNITINAPAGTPVDGQRIVLRIKDNGSTRNLTWTSTSGNYRAVGVTIPTATTAGKVTYVGAIYNGADTYWDVVAVVTQA